MLKSGTRVRYIGTWKTMLEKTGTVIQHWPEDRDAGEIIPACARVRPDHLQKCKIHERAALMPNPALNLVPFRWTLRDKVAQRQ